MRIHPAISLRPMSLSDVPLLDHWDTQPHVISATSDDPDMPKAFGDTYWPDELALVCPSYRYYMAELSGRPIGAMQIIDPHIEPTHYWGEIEPNLRAIDIWIGALADTGQGYGESMMRLAFQMCFADGDVTAIVIDPLASNTRAHRFYQRLGFVPEGRRTFGDDDCLVHRLTRADWRARTGARVSQATDRSEADQPSSSSLPPTGMFGAVALVVITSSGPDLPAFHWPATSGVFVTFLTGPLPHATGPTIV